MKSSSNSCNFRRQIDYCQLEMRMRIRQSSSNQGRWSLVIGQLLYFLYKESLTYCTLYFTVSFSLCVYSCTCWVPMTWTCVLAVMLVATLVATHSHSPWSSFVSDLNCKLPRGRTLCLLLLGFPTCTPPRHRETRVSQWKRDSRRCTKCC